MNFQAADDPTSWMAFLVRSVAPVAPKDGCRDTTRFSRTMTWVSIIKINTFSDPDRYSVFQRLTKRTYFMNLSLQISVVAACFIIYYCILKLCGYSEANLSS